LNHSRQGQRNFSLDSILGQFLSQATWSPPIFWKRLCRIGGVLPLAFGEVTSEPYGPGIFFVGKHLTIDSTFLTDIKLFKLSISFKVSFGN
jgi:hypothetical protein